MTRPPRVSQLRAMADAARLRERAAGRRGWHDVAALYAELAAGLEAMADQAAPEGRR